MLMRLVDPLAVLLISAGKEDSKRFPVRGRMSYYDWPAAEWQQLPSQGSGTMAPSLISSSPLRIRSYESADLTVTLMGLAVSLVIGASLTM